MANDNCAPQSEDTYEQTMNLFHALPCMKPCDDKISLCEKLAEKFKQFDAYEDASKNRKKCKKMIQETKAYQLEYAYQEACRHMNEASAIHEYEQIEKEFRQLEDYKDSRSLQEQCQKMQKSVEKHLFLRAKLQTALAVLVVALIVMLQFDFGKYYGANALMKVHLYEQAGQTYQKLADYKDSNVRWKECEYQYGRYLRKWGDNEKALKCFQNAGSRHDSDKLTVELQKKVLADKKVGKSIKVGDCNWIILCKEGSQVLLMKKAAITNTPFSSDASTVDWTTSTVRSWLNTEYIAAQFSAEEADNIQLYHSQGTENYITADKLVLLSQDEISLYRNKDLKCNSNHWLRTMSAENGKAMFLSPTGKIMSNGYAIDSDQLCLHPVFWYSID